MTASKVALTALFCVFASFGWATAADAPCTNPPSDVADYLRTHHGWKILQVGDLVSDDQALWNQYHRGQCPGMTLVDFDGSGEKFLALALLSHSNGKTTEKVVAIRHAKRGLKEYTLAAPWSGGIVVIWRSGPDIAKEWDSTKKVHIPHGSLIVEKMESAAQQFYLSHGKFHYVQISD